MRPAVTDWAHFFVIVSRHSYGYASFRFLELHPNRWLRGLRAQGAKGHGSTRRRSDGVAVATPSDGNAVMAYPLAPWAVWGRLPLS